MRKAPPMKKTTSFKQEVITRTYHDMTSESDAAIESDSEDDVDKSAREEEESEDGGWEDEGDEGESGPSSLKDGGMFRRLELTSSHTPHCSLLTALLKDDRGKALQNEASGSTSAMKPIIQTTSNNIHPPAMAPRTARRLMADAGLTSS
jgi:hypothetical protein